MTGGGDLDEVRDDDGDGESRDPGKEVDPADGGFLNDSDPTAGASDVGGRAGDDDDDTRGEDQHEVGGGQTGMGKGPTGS
ncbi:MAG: hypothetical protein QOI11_1611 [Candidatus Eremiobacteraeota bacterium]|jgi:hypothetical protein|nr:hypothetical protein [Candidatus Eremiobacteraeota bacterium]